MLGIMARLVREAAWAFMEDEALTRGAESADLVQAALQGAAHAPESILASVVGAVTLLVTASGVFAEMQAALNALWRAPPRATTVSRLVRARIVSLGLVAALGFLLLVSLVVSALLAGLGGWINARLPWGTVVLGAVNIFVSYVLVTALFAAIYKWIYWSAQIFLFGAELTKVYAAWRGTRAGRQAVA